MRCAAKRNTVNMKRDDLLMKHATDTANDYMMAAIRCIDAHFGNGYAQSHPELIAAFMMTAAKDYQTAQQGLSFEGIISSLDKIPTSQATTGP